MEPSIQRLTIAWVTYGLHENLADVPKVVAAGAQSMIELAEEQLEPAREVIRSAASLDGAK